MPWKKILLLMILFVVLVQSAPSITIDELLHPLLRFKQLKLSPELKMYSVKHSSVLIGFSPMSYLSSNLTCSPRVTYGLKKNLQLSINGTYQFPMEFSHPRYYEWDYRKEKKTLRTLSGELIYRPLENLQLIVSWFGGDYKEKINYARNEKYNALRLAHFNTHVLTFSGTWLSRSTHSFKIIKPDLDGLHHPLLDKGQIKIQPEIQINWYDYSFYDSDDSPMGLFEDNIGYKRVNILTGIAYGITGKFQVEGNFLFVPPFYINNDSESLHTWGISTTHSIGHDRKKLFRHIGGKVELIYRFNPQFELFSEGIYYRYKVLNRIISERYIDGTLQFDYQNEERSFFKNWSLKLGGSWVSRPKREGIPLTSDLAGLNHPLLEKKQVKIDGFVYYRYFKRFLENNFIRLNTTANYGLFKSFQLSGSFGLHFYKYVFPLLKYENKFTGKLAIKFRPKESFEIYLTANYNPFFIERFPPPLNRYEQELTYIDLRNSSYAERLNLVLGIIWLL